MSDATPGLRQNTQAEPLMFSISKPFDLTGVFSGPSVPLPYKYRLFSSHPHPDSTTPRVPLSPVSTLFPTTRSASSLPHSPLTQHASCRQQRNAHLGDQHLLEPALPVWRLGPKRKGC